MKFACALFLAFLIVIHINSLAVLQLVYENNAEYFTKNFCVNVDKPAMKCNGKCHLTKTISKILKSQKEQPKVLNISQFFMTCSVIFVANIDFKLNDTNYRETTTFYFFNFYSNILKPPILRF